MISPCLKLTGKDLAYWERNQLVLYLSKIFPSWKERHPDEDIEWENDYKNIIFIQFPEGLFSWHISDSELDYFKHLKFKVGNSWNGTTTQEKYQTMNKFRSKKIAKIAYRDIKSVIDKWEKENDCIFSIHFHWDGCITINDELFHERELIDNKDIYT